jgi:hypothetical protein
LAAAMLAAAVCAPLALCECAKTDPLESTGKPKVEYVGEPSMRSLATGGHIVEISFGGQEYVLADPSYNYDPDYIQSLIWPPFVICRYADYIWEGEVKNVGDAAAESVYVRIEFAGGYTDSAYVNGLRVRPNEVVGYQLYSRGTRIDSKEIIWYEPPEEG